MKELAMVKGSKAEYYKIEKDENDKMYLRIKDKDVFYEYTKEIESLTEGLEEIARLEKGNLF